MVKLTNTRIKWGVKKIISNKLTTKEVAEIYEVTPRRFQILVKEYKETGVYPVMKKERRPRTELSEEDKKKKRQRKYCRYQRDHSFSLVHLDWHDSKFIKDWHVCVVEDDASRLILCGGEFDNEEAINNINLMKQAIKISYEKYSAVIREANSDKGTQFYNSKFTNDGRRPLCEFEKFLDEQGIKHIPSRIKHPQTNGKQERWFRTYEENRHK